MDSSAVASSLLWAASAASLEKATRSPNGCDKHVVIADSYSTFPTGTPRGGLQLPGYDKHTELPEPKAWAVAGRGGAWGRNLAGSDLGGKGRAVSGLCSEAGC